MRIFTAGHSTRTLAEMAGVLRAHGVQVVCDVRAHPGSRRHPHFAREPFAAGLAEAGIDYLWLGAELGGRRKGLGERSPHVALRNASFRAYADHMETPEFARGMQRLLDRASSSACCVLCAELLWWRCHRRLIADVLVLLHGVEVVHIFDAGEAKPHVPGDLPRVVDGRLLYA